MKLTPTAPMRDPAPSPGPGSPNSTSTHRSTSGPPNSSMRIAFVIVSHPLRLLARTVLPAAAAPGPTFALLRCGFSCNPER